MPTFRDRINGLNIAECHHPWLAFQHLAPFATVEEEKRANTPEAKKKISEQKSAHIRSVLDSRGFDRDDHPLRQTYSRAFDNRQSCLKGFNGGISGAVTRFFSLPVQGRLAAGLGNASVLENGLSLNHTYGLPYLPGTGLKGMASAMAHLGLADVSWKRGVEKDGKWVGQGADHNVLFGTMDTGAEDAAAGIVIFHDAWWDPTDAENLPFEPDVMTPHHQKYNLDGGDWPNDWESPIPVPFVTVRGTFRVALTGPSDWVEAAFEILKMAFEHLGFGAKTQIGHGRGELSRFESEDEKGDRLRREAESNADAEAKQAILDEQKRIDKLARLEATAEWADDGKLVRTDAGRGLHRLTFRDHKFENAPVGFLANLADEAWDNIQSDVKKRGEKGGRVRVRFSLDDDLVVILKLAPMLPSA